MTMDYHKNPGVGGGGWVILVLVTFYPTALKGCWGIVFIHGVGVGGRQEEVCPGWISETVRDIG